MKKRILGAVLTIAMVFSSFASVIAAPQTNDYDAIKPLQTEEKVLDQLNADVSANIFDKDWHEQQLNALKAVNENFSSLAAAAEWSDYIRVVYSEREVEYIENYMKTLKLAAADPASQIATQLEAADAQYDTTGNSLKVSFGKLAYYKERMRTVFNNNRAALNGCNLSDDEIKTYLLMPTKLVFNAIFSQIGTSVGVDSKALQHNYNTSWLGDDRAKKLYAMLFGEALTGELASDEDNAGVTAALKEFMQTRDGIIFVKNELAKIFEATNTREAAIDAMYDFIGNVLYKAYTKNNLTAEEESLREDIQMLFGGNGKTGAFEYGMKAIDTDRKAANALLNLFLSHYVQTKLSASNVDLNTITSAFPKDSQVETDARKTISDNTSINFVPAEIFDEYGITDENVKNQLSLANGWFDLVCYVNDTNTENPYVEFDGSKIQITENPSEGETYNAYLVLFRKGTADTAERFIESYPVIINNKTISTSGGGGTTRYSVKYETNGGGAISTEYYVKGTKVQLTKVPVREGYIFNGWYSDAALTQRVESVEMNRNIIVYAAWTKDGSSVVSKVDIPDKLNGEEHFAYVIGYPEGDVRPQNSITRAEAVTILFRLLKDDVRDANMTDVNVFTDVNDGDWYNTAVSTLAALEIVNGRTQTEFMPNEYITRAEFATIFARFSEYSYTVIEEFLDVDGHWAESYINEAAAYGWIAGYEDNTFRPDNRITRAEAMTLINRVLKRNPENKDALLEDMSVWTDNADTSAWYYLAVQEATNSHEYVRKNESYETWTKLTENRDWTTYEK